MRGRSRAPLCSWTMQWNPAATEGQYRITNSTIKAALDILGRPGGWPRDPIKPVTPEGREIMRRVLIDAGILEGEEARKRA